MHQLLIKLKRRAWIKTSTRVENTDLEVRMEAYIDVLCLSFVLTRELIKLDSCWGQEIGW